MKVLALALAMREVSPNPNIHPKDRLRKLTKFSKEMLDKWFDQLASHDAWVEKFETNTARMEKNFDRVSDRGKKCAFYNPSHSSHGGLTKDEIEEYNSSRSRRSVDMIDMMDGIETLDEFFETNQTGSEERYDRGDARVAVRQICTGFKKWSDRYLTKCSGQRQYQYQSKRMEKWQQRLLENYRKIETKTFAFDERDVY